MKKALISLRKKPSKPKRVNITVKLELHDGMTMKDVITYFDLVEFVEIEIVKEYESWDDSSTTYARYTRQQTNEEFAVDRRLYLGRMKKYNQWYDDNRTLIEKEIRRREGLATLTRQRNIRKEQVRLNKELSVLTKQLKKGAQS